MHGFLVFNSFEANVPFLHSLKTSEPGIFWCFRDAWKRNINLRWFKNQLLQPLMARSCQIVKKITFKILFFKGKVLNFEVLFVIIIFVNLLCPRKFTCPTKKWFIKMYSFQKQPPRRILRKSCSENMQQIYWKTPMSKCDFNKVAKQLYWNYTSAWVFSCKYAAYFQSTFF